MVMTPFEHWWYHEGSQPPTAGHDMEEHCKRMCKIAWDNGAFKERQRIADHLDDSMLGDYSALREQVRSGVLWP
ncbi:MAG: hypothetical protein RL758_304 [Pseudomonadota bacterium]|jgi:hypothetical protein